MKMDCITSVMDRVLNTVERVDGDSKGNKSGRVGHERVLM